MDLFIPAGADAVDFGRLTKIRVAALVLPALSISGGRLAELSVGFFLERGLDLAGAASASAMRKKGVVVVGDRNSNK
jgi:hypothetical protein